VKDIIQNIRPLQVESPVDKIILQIKQLMITGQLKPGDRLPAERQLAEKFGVGRSYVREAILKLEFYGLLRTSPQSGTYVSGLSIKVLDNLISDIIKLNKDNFSALIEARYYMELDAVRLAAERRTEKDLHGLKLALADYELKISQDIDAVDEDMLFHIKIAECTKNSVIESMMLALIPDLIKNIVESKICGKDRGRLAVKEHREILRAIEEQNIDAAENAMAAHLDEVLQIARTAFIANQIIG